mgnify:CR=1 FL=1
MSGVKTCWEANYTNDRDWVCSECGHGIDVCQDRDEGMRGYMYRSGSIGNGMTDEEKRSYDLHHPQHAGDFDTDAANAATIEITLEAIESAMAATGMGRY